MKKLEGMLGIGSVVLLVVMLSLLVNYQAYVIEKQRTELQGVIMAPCGFKFVPPGKK